MVVSAKKVSTDNVGSSVFVFGFSFKFQIFANEIKYIWKYNLY